MKTKKCSNCKCFKDLSAFCKNKSCTDKYNATCKTCCKKYKQENKARLSNYQKEYYKNWRQKNKEHLKNYRELNKEKIKLLKQKHYNTNKEKIKIRHAKYCKKRYQEDSNFRLTHLLRTRLNKVLKGKMKFFSMEVLLDCSIEFLKKHLESKFKSGMTWDNHGKWHIDHIKPCAKFDFSKESEQRKCFHYTNLQPLWAIENLTKNKY